MPSISQLEYIVAVDKVRHFAKAAKACHVTQPTLSMQLVKAEEELGLVIFDRERQPVEPTEKGLEVIDQAKTILREYQRLLSHSKKSASEVSGSYRLSVIPTIAPYLLPLFLAKFTKRYPKVQLTIDERKTEDIITSLRSDDIDGAILATPLNESALTERVLFYEPFYLYLGENHPLKNKKSVTESDVDRSGLWLLQDGHCLRSQILSFCSFRSGEASVIESVKFQGGNLETLRYLIQANGGCTFIPHLFLDKLSPHERSNLVKPFRGDVPTREVSLVTRRDQLHGSISQALSDTVQKSLPSDLLNSSARKNILPIG